MRATTDLCDAHPDVRVFEPVFRSFGGASAFGGALATVKAPDDNSLVRKALEEPGGARVLVVDGGGSLRCALVGGNLAALGAANGWAGIVVFGCGRDVAELRAANIGVLALARHPRKSDKRGLGERDVPLTFAGVTLRPGEFLYADEDGVIVSGRALD